MEDEDTALRDAELEKPFRDRIAKWARTTAAAQNVSGEQIRILYSPTRPRPA